MTRIFLLFLTIGAFAYALWLVLRGKPLPQTGQAHGLKRRFLLATLLFVGLMSQSSKGRSTVDASGQPRSEPNVSAHAVEPDDLWITVKTVWRTLDPNQAEGFRLHLETAVADGQIRQRVTDILSAAFAEISVHNTLTRQNGSSGPITPCYMVRRNLRNRPEFSSETALRQIELLHEYQEAGVLDAHAPYIHETLAKEIEMMWHLGRIPLDEWMALSPIWERYWTSTPPIDSAAMAAKLIVESEGGTIPSLTPMSRFQTMQQQVQLLLRTGPVFSDWRTYSVSPSIASMLETMRLIPPQHTCYRGLPRATERSAELQTLQINLLEQCVDANLIDEQIAIWASDPNGAAPNTIDPNAMNPHAVALPVDFALDTEIRTYQKQLRSVMVHLYESGEVPTSFMRDVELAADIEILPVDANEARRRDMGYFFHALLDCPSREPFVIALEERGLIPPAQNHRMVMYNYSESCEADPDENHVAIFAALLDGNIDLVLEDDKYLVWPASLIPTRDLDYRLTLRRVCRILTYFGYTDTQWLAAVEESIGIPVIATISEDTDEIINHDPPPSGR